MKKHLLILGAAMLSTTLPVMAYEPDTVDDCAVTITSPNGAIGVSDDGTGVLIIVDYLNNEIYPYVTEYIEDEVGNLFVGNSYSKGMGNCISNTGIVVGNIKESMADGSYWENGEWHTIPTPDGVTSLQFNGITADGTSICGVAGKTGEGIPGVPFVITRDSEGNFSQLTWLPYPTVDFTGRTPQNITALCISDDGKTIAGQVWDYYGGIREPIVFTEDADGNWSYKLIESNFYGHTWPEAPGEPPVMPEVEDYMTALEKAAYQTACDNFEGGYLLPEPQPKDYMSAESWAEYEQAYAEWDVTTSPWPPSPTSYMSEEEAEAYNTALEEFYNSAIPYPEPKEYMSLSEYEEYVKAATAYNEEFDAWCIKQEAFQNEYYSMMEIVPMFDPNNAILSSNGRYYASTSMGDYAGIAYRYDLQENTSKSYDTTDMYVSYVNNDGIIMGGTPIYAYTRTGLILESTDGDFIPLDEYIASKNEEMGKWVDAVCPGVGTPSGAQNLSIIWAWGIDEDTFEYVTRIIPVDLTTGIKAVDGVKFGIKVVNNGVVDLQGNADDLTVYNLKGEKVFTTRQATGSVATDLPAGFYLVKAKGADGSLVIKKIAIK